MFWSTRLCPRVVNLGATTAVGLLCRDGRGCRPPVDRSSTRGDADSAARNAFFPSTLHGQLNKEAFVYSIRLIADLMREMGLAAIQPRAFIRTTTPDDQAQLIEDHLDRNFDPAEYIPGEALVSDITYSRTGEGWLY